VIATGVSLNVGITGLTIEAINRGFDVVVPTDCVAGYPLDYGKLVLERTIAQIATLTSSAALVEAWGG
jgi:nicotinamidase-related amidase